MSGRTISFQPKQHTILDPRGPKHCNYTMIIRNYTTKYCIGVFVCFSLYEAGGRLSAGVAYIAVFQIFTYLYFTDEYLLSPDFQVWNYSQIILTFDVLTTLSD